MLAVIVTAAETHGTVDVDVGVDIDIYLDVDVDVDVDVDTDVYVVKGRDMSRQDSVQWGREEGPSGRRLYRKIGEGGCSGRLFL